MTLRRAIWEGSDSGRYLFRGGIRCCKFSFRNFVSELEKRLVCILPLLE